MKKTKDSYLLIFSLFFVLSSCTSKETKKNDENCLKDTAKLIHNSFETVGDSIIIPEFEIEIQLSAKAESKTTKDNESIIVQAYFSGIPKDTTTKEYKKWRQIDIGNHKIELWGSRIAQFKNVKLPKKAIDKLCDSNFKVTINVFTGRHASNNNLLNCEVLIMHINKLKGQRNVLKGKLISEG